jgi:hypothetical protein
MDRMEDVMLGTRRTVPLWRQKQRRLVQLERALALGKPDAETHVEQAVISAKAAQRRLDETKRRQRFSDSD